MKVAREEIFGPVACFMQPFKSDEEVIALANDNVYGLTSWVWTTDMARGMRFANQIQAGTVGLGQGSWRRRAGIPLGRIQGKRDRKRRFPIRYVRVYQPQENCF